MFGLGFGEVILLAVIALLVIGPEQLPTVARNVARFLNELKRTTEEFKKELDKEDGISATLNEIKQMRAENILKLEDSENKKATMKSPETSVVHNGKDEEKSSSNVNSDSSEIEKIEKGSDSNE